MQPFLLPQAIGAAVRRAPDNPALCSAAGERWSYGRLWEVSGAAARALRGAGLIPGARVGVWMRKSPAAVAALLGILRAGGIYVPLDAWAPEARIAAMAQDCGLWGLYADADLATQAAAWMPATAWLAPAGWDTARTELTAVAAMGASGGNDLEAAARTGDDVAYILYTSGSTGVPKGVMLTHAHALNFTQWAGTALALGAGDRVASHAPFHFDLSIFDLWATLSHGAEVCLLDPVTARFPAAVAEWIAERGIRVWYSTPSALVALLPHLPRLAALEPGPRAVIFAGEPFPPAALRQWRAALPRAEFHNWFGPTETNVCTAYRLPPLAAEEPLGRTDPEAPALPIGWACPGFELALLDDEGVEVDTGETGFLWVRGPGILAGYWGDERRTAVVTARRTPAAGGPPQRWYNTGDRARRGAGGVLFFEGRRDALIKLRGYRVSLLEIEDVLAACPGVEQAVVVPLLHPGNAGSVQRLHAVVGASRSTVTVAEMRAWARRRLPVYMVPDVMEIRAALPQTSTGKLDRQLLARQAAAAAERGAAPVKCA